MKKPRTLADPKLAGLLSKLLLLESLPALDRWFSATARTAGWSVPEQKRLWDSLRRALVRSYGLLASTGSPLHSAWPGVRAALKHRVEEWAIRAELSLTASTVEGAGIPAWLTGALSDRQRRSAWSTVELAKFLEFQELSSPAYVRFKQGLEGEACLRRLVATGTVEPSEVKGLYRLREGRGLESSEDFKSGKVEIQDAASQLSLSKLGLRPGMRVWDVCAGQGGKTLLAASELVGKGAIVATDISAGKLKALKDRVRRSGWQNIRILPWAGEELPAFGPEMAASGGFDRVIVDAPCSATGTWRRDPEARFRLTTTVLEDLRAHQKRLLRLGWLALKPGGRLAYITCSWLPVENEAIVEDFLGSVGARVLHQDLLGLPAFDANTLFVCILEKR